MLQKTYKRKMKFTKQIKFNRKDNLLLNNESQLEKILTPNCELSLDHGHFRPNHRSRNKSLMAFDCYDSRGEDCPFHYNKDDKRFCKYKK